MGNYLSEQTLERIRQATDIVGLVRESVVLKKAGAAYKGLCPFHKEKTPSFHVNTERQIFKCFGCGAAGDVFSYLMKSQGLTFVEAVRSLAERAHMELPQEEYDGAPRSEKAGLYEVNAWVADFFHRCLTKSSVGAAARKYLEKRGIAPETVKTFELGVAPDSWDTILKAAEKRKFSRAVLLKAGLVIANERNDSLYDRFRNRLMFPIRDVQEHVIGFGARELDGSEPKYLNSPETPLFSKGKVLYGIHRARKALSEQKTAIVVEGYMDVIMCHQFNIPHTVGVLGTALTRDHVQTLRRYVESAVLLFDPDSAGVTAVHRSLDAFAAEEMPARVASLPDGKDPDELLLSDGASEFLARVEKAADAITWKLDRALADGDIRTRAGAETMRALDDVLATISLMPSSAAQGIELRRVAERTGLPEPALQQRVAGLKSRGRQDDTPEEDPRRHARDAERELLQVMLEHPHVIGEIRRRFDASLIRDDDVRTIVQRILTRSADETPLRADEWLGRTQSEPLRGIIEETLSREARADDPAAWCAELIAHIEAREHSDTSAQLHRKVSAGKTRSREEQDVTLADRLRAAREAQSKRGLLKAGNS